MDCHGAFQSDHTPEQVEEEYPGYAESLRWQILQQTVAEAIDLKVTAEELDAMHAHAGSYEALFSRRAMKFRSMGLAERNLSEDDYRQLILEEYTFLKRPVLLTENAVFAGSAKASVEGARAALKG